MCKRLTCPWHSAALAVQMKALCYQWLELGLKVRLVAAVRHQQLRSFLVLIVSLDALTIRGC